MLDFDVMASAAARGAARTLGRLAAVGGSGGAAICAARAQASWDVERTGLPNQRRVADVEELHHLLVCAERTLLLSSPSLDLRNIREWHFNHEYHGAIVVRELDASRDGFHQVRESSEDVLKRRKVSRRWKRMMQDSSAEVVASSDKSLAAGSEAADSSAEGTSAEVLQAADSSAEGTPAEVLQAAVQSASSFTSSLADTQSMITSSAGQGARDCYDYATGETEHRRRECYYVYYETSPEGNKYEDVFVRGTTVWSDVFGNLYFYKVYDEELGMYIHNGFLSKATQTIDDMQPLLSKEAEITLSGHSLGGAVAAIVGLKLRRRGFNVTGIYTFGAPKFCAALDDTVLTACSQSRRQALLGNLDFVSVTKPKDPVPHMPLDDPRSLFVGGYTPAAKRQLRLVREENPHGVDHHGGAGISAHLDEVPHHLYASLYGYYGFWAMDGGLLRRDVSEHYMLGYRADLEEALTQAVRDRSISSAALGSAVQAALGSAVQAE